MRRFVQRIHCFGKNRHKVLIVLYLTSLVFSVALASEAWNCPECGRTGNTGNYCGGCGNKSPYIEGQTDDSSQETDSAAEFRKAGSIVTFGRYEQDNKTENGQEEIEWVVLDYDEKGKKTLLLSRYGLDVKPYNEKEEATTWSKCTLRTWLNDSFLNTAFTTEERNAILLTDVDNSSVQGYGAWSTSGGDNSQDKVFLLSYAEANKYFGVTTGSNDNTQSRVEPTAYAIKQGAYTAGGTAAGWWLRSPGHIQNVAVYVNADGALHGYSVNAWDVVVRPALWINLESGIF